MVEKDAGRPKVSRLRVIHLLEAAYNFFHKSGMGKKTNVESPKSPTPYGGTASSTR